MPQLDDLIEKLKSKRDKAQLGYQSTPAYKEYEKQCMILEALTQEIEEAKGLESSHKAPDTTGSHKSPELPRFVTGDSNKKRKGSFISQVKNSITDFGSKEFTVDDVLSLLESKGTEVISNNPKVKISGALIKLAKTGFLEKTFAGTGGLPSQYRLVSDDFSLV